MNLIRGGARRRGLRLRGLRLRCEALCAIVMASAMTPLQELVSQESPSDSVFQLRQESWPTTAAEQSAGWNFLQDGDVLSDDRTHRIPQDDRDSALVRRVRRWVADLQQEKITGLQLDPMGRLAIIAGQDALAKRQFDMRLSAPNVAMLDRAYTLMLATQTFGGDGTNAARMQVAQHYLAQLMALPATAGPLQFAALSAIGKAYFLAGIGSAAVTQLRQSLALIPRLAFDDRNWIDVHYNFVLMSNVLSGQPNGRATIDSIGAALLPYTVAPPALLAADSMYYQYMSKVNRVSFQNTLRLAGYLGRPAPAIEAQYWFNTPRPSIPSSAGQSAAVKRLDDGKIRIMEYGHYGCPGCLASLPAMERIRKVVPSNVETWFVAIEDDMWGATLQTADEAAEHYRKFYIDRKKYGLPIAIWIGKRKPSIEGGTNTQSSPTFDAYSFVGWPWFLVTDGQGIVRSIQMGMSEESLLRTMRYLVAEAARTGTRASQQASQP